MRQKAVGKNATFHTRSTPVMRYLLQAYQATSHILTKCHALDSLKPMFDMSAEVSKEVAAIEAEIKSLLSLQAEIKSQVISASEDVRYRQILELRYVNGLSMHEAAERMGYGRRWAERLHNKALKNFEQYLIANKINYQSA